MAYFKLYLTSHIDDHGSFGDHEGNGIIRI